MRLIDAALRYAGQGWPVFPCAPNKKTPLGNLAPNGVLSASTNPATIRQWWEREPDANIGIHVGAAGMAVIDLDPDDQGNLPDYDPTPTSLVAKTPRGGEHHFYAIGEGEVIPPSASVIAPHVDVRSHNSYVLLAPSKTPDGDYQWAEEGQTNYRPDELLEVSHRERDPEHDVWTIEPDLEENVIAAAKWLTTDAKVAIEGQGGDGVAYATAAHLRSFGISEAKALELMVDHWNPRNVPPWHLDQLDHLEIKVKNAYAYATSKPGNITPAFKAVERKAAFKCAKEDDGSETYEFGRYTIRNRAAINHIPQPSWLLKGVIPANSYCIMYAPEASFKTFIALDMALSIACGFPQDPAIFSDADILQPGPVLYITGEGLGGIRKRIAGWEATHNGGSEVTNFDLFDPAPKLTEDIQALTDFVKSVRDDYKLIVVDTVARVMQGMNENVSESVTAFTSLVDAMRSIGQDTSVLALHHTNKEGGIRGFGAFSADADAVLRLEERKQTGNATYQTELTTIKMKDAPDQTKPLQYNLTEVSLGEATTLVPTKATSADTAEQPGTTRQSANTKAIEARSARNKSALRRADYAMRRTMIEAKALEVLSLTAGKAWSIRSLATAVAHGLENVSESNARDHISSLKTDETSELHARFDPVASRFK